MDTLTSGQAPTPTTEDQSTQGQEPGAEQAQAPDVDALLREVKALRKEAATWRTKLRAAEEAEAERQRAEMTELERLKADLEAERQARAQADEQRRAQLVRTQVIAAAAKAGFNDTNDAIALLDMAGLEVGEDGAIDGLDEAITALVKAKQYLVKTASGTISLTNPAGGPQRTTADQLRQEMFGVKRASVFEGGGVLWPSQE